jgi:hypothetical protein
MRRVSSIAPPISELMEDFVLDCVMYETTVVIQPPQ